MSAALGASWYLDVEKLSPRSHPAVGRYTAEDRPRTNGSADRLDRTLVDECFYIGVFISESERRVRLQLWEHDYSSH